MDIKDYEALGGIQADYWWFKGKRDLIRRLLRKLSKENCKILNVGSGMGEDIEMFNQFGNTYSIDISREVMEKMSKSQLENFSIMSAENLGFKDKSFDIVLMLDLLEHLEKDKKAIEEAFRVMKDGAYLIITVPAMPFLFGPFDKLVHHHRRYSKKILNNLLNRRFEIKKITFWNFFLFIPSSTIKLTKKFFSSKKETSDMVRLPSIVNGLFFSLLQVENTLIENGINLPFGTSLVVLCKKRESNV